MNALASAGTDPIAVGLSRYVDFLASMTPDTVENLDDHVTPDVHFRDPFNDLHGVAAMKAVFHHMYRDCTDVRFVIGNTVQQGPRAFVTWTFYFRPRRLRGTAPWQADGVTELHFDAGGRVAAHLDHWDAGAQFYARLPVLGALIRLVRNRLRLN